MSPAQPAGGDTGSLRVLVMGGGLMGSQIGCEYALAGHAVTFAARDTERVVERVNAALQLIRSQQLAPTSEIDAAIGRIRTDRVLDDALSDAFDLVVESVTEDLELKGGLFRRAAASSPDAILATNTSSLAISAIGRACGAPERMVGTHYWNPPLLMPPVEVVAGDQTAPDVFDRMVAIVAALGKEPIVVRRDVPGFIWNRLQHALLREVLWLVENDVATPATIDQVVRSGLARRSRFTGPFETIALGGVDAWSRVAVNLFPELSNADGVGDLGRWIDQDQAELDAIRARRDRGLADQLRARDA